MDKQILAAIVTALIALAAKIAEIAIEKGMLRK